MHISCRCVAELQEWSARSSLARLLAGAYSLLRFPVFAHTPANVEAEDAATYAATAREWTIKYAKEEMEM
eukprot:tig00021350_g20638.t1